MERSIAGDRIRRVLGLRLDLPDDAPLRVLCLGAHCDDIEIGAGGTLRRLLRERADVHVRWEVLASTPEREVEARASAAELLAGAAEATVEVHRFRESYFPEQWAALKDHLFEVRARFAADLVLTHHRHDRHQDHRTIAELSWNAFRDHLLLEYEVPKYEGDLGRPNVFVALDEDVAAEKVDGLLRHFPSQAGKPWFDAEAFRSLLRLRGLECNARWAEAFHGDKLRL